MTTSDSGMELQAFITSAITQIVAGVEGARAELQSHEGDAKVNPKSKPSNDADPTSVRFDIAVSATSKSEKGGKGGIRVLSLEVGGHAGTEVSTETVSRIQFEVPVALPRTEPDQYKMPQRSPPGRII